MNIIQQARVAIKSRLKELDAERSKLLRAVGVLGAGVVRKGKAKRVSRRKMNAAQKKAVSLRMKAYWAKRRASK